MSARLVQAKPEHAGLPQAFFDGACWAVARSEDPLETGPVLPTHTSPE